MDSYFKKINVEIFYPEFDIGYDKKISSIHYQVIYPDMKGNPVSKVKCIMDSGKAIDNNNLQLAVWTASLKYNYMRFEFLKNDGPHADLTISRTIYYMPEMPESSVASKIIINTGPEEVSNFIVISKTAPAYVHNKIDIAIMDLGSSSKPPNVFRAAF